MFTHLFFLDFHQLLWCGAFIPDLLFQQTEIRLDALFEQPEFTCRNGAGHIGYSIRKDARGKGCGTIGPGLAIEIAKQIIPEDEIYLRVNKDNIASRRVMLKNGAYQAGEDESHYFLRIPIHA